MRILKNITNKERNQSAFTLIELLVVVVIIGILATLATVALTTSRANARDARRISDLKQIATALELYQADNNSYPALITGGNSLASPDGSKVYMKKVPSDPSTNTSYAYGGSASRFTIRTNIEKAVESIPVGPVIITNNGSVRQALNTDNSYMNPDLTFGALVGHWALNGISGTSDLSGYNHHGTLISVGTVTSTGRYGESDGGYNLDGDDYVSIADANVLDPGTGDYSYVASFKTGSDVTTARAVFNKGSQSLASFWCACRVHSGSVRCYISDASGGTYWVNSLSGSVSPNTYYQIVLSLDRDGKQIFYQNGVLTEEQTASNTVNINSSATYPLLIGKQINPFVGDIYELRLYSKALTADDVVVLYNATRP